MPPRLGFIVNDATNILIIYLCLIFQYFQVKELTQFEAHPWSIPGFLNILFHLLKKGFPL